jgi:hypothetical protein
MEGPDRSPDMTRRIGRFGRSGEYFPIGPGRGGAAQRLPHHFGPAALSEVTEKVRATNLLVVEQHLQPCHSSYPRTQKRFHRAHAQRVGHKTSLAPFHPY